MNEIIESGINTTGTELAFVNKQLARHTAQIEKLMNGVKKNMVEIAVRLAVIKEENLFEQDGFTDVFDYALKTFDYKKATVYKMIASANKYIEKTADGKGYQSILIRDGEDYTVTQLMELNGLEVEEAEQLNKANKIDPSMTAKDIREVVKEYQNKKKQEEEPEEPEEEQQEEPEEPEEPEEVDRTALAILTVSEDLVNILLDERLTKEQKKKIDDFKCWILGIEL